MSNPEGAYSDAVERANALVDARVRALQAKDDAEAQRLAAEYLIALADVERLMPEAERRKRDALVAGAGRLVGYAKALERGDRREMDRLYDEMSDEERASVQHAHDLE